MFRAGEFGSGFLGLEQVEWFWFKVSRLLKDFYLKPLRAVPSRGDPFLNP